MEGMITVGKNNPDDEVFVFNSYLGPPRTSSEFKKNKKGSPFRQIAKKVPFPSAWSWGPGLGRETLVCISAAAQGVWLLCTV